MTEFWIFGLMFLITGALAALLIGAMFALAILMPPRMTDGKAVYLLSRLTPMDLGIAYQETTFLIEHEGKRFPMVAWWMPCLKSEKTVVLIHGRADAKVGAIAWAPSLLRLGYNVLAVDLRAHGQSGGKHSTAGYFERHDLSFVIDQARKTWEGSWNRIFLMGLSMGGAAALATASLRDDISGVIVDSTYLRWREISWKYLEMSGYGFKYLHQLALLEARWISGADPAKVEPRKTLLETKAPVLWIEGAEDPLKDPLLPEIGKIRQSRGMKFRTFEIPQAGHLEGIVKNTTVYEDTLGKWMHECENGEE